MGIVGYRKEKEILKNEIRSMIKKDSYAKGIMIYGPPGTGKSTVIREMTEKFKVPYIRIDCGIPESFNISLYSAITRSRASPTILHIDKPELCVESSEHPLRSIGSKINALISFFDLTEHLRCLVIAESNYPDLLPETLLAPHRIGKYIYFHLPTYKERVELIQYYLPNRTKEEIKRLSDMTQGFSGAAIKKICGDISEGSTFKFHPAISPFSLTSCENFYKETEQPFLPTYVTFEEIGGLEEVKKELKKALKLFLHESLKEKFGIDPPRGILLYGPPGCGKTMLIMALRTEMERKGIYSIYLTSTSLQSSYVGESAKNIRKTYSEARNNAPSVVIIEDIDGIALQRGGGLDGAELAKREVVVELLGQLDYQNSGKNVLTIASTNSIESIDPALLRSGRLGDFILYVPPPNIKEREEILKKILTKPGFETDIDIKTIARYTETYTGAQLKNLCMKVMGDKFIDSGTEGKIKLTTEDFLTKIERKNTQQNKLYA